MDTRPHVSPPTHGPPVHHGPHGTNAAAAVDLQIHCGLTLIETASTACSGVALSWSIPKRITDG